MDSPLATAWRSAAASRGSAPFVTRCGRDTRTELSGTAFTQWVAKCANYLEDEFDAGITVGVRLAPHWLWPVLVAAVVEIDGVLALDGRHDVLVTTDRSSTGEVLLVHDHPFALPFREPLPAGARDFFLEVRAGADFRPALRVESGVRLRTDEQEWSEVEWIDAFATGAAAERYLLRSDGLPVADAWTVAAMSAIPWLGGGSLVIADGDTDVTAERPTRLLSR